MISDGVEAYYHRQVNEVNRWDNVFI